MNTFRRYGTCVELEKWWGDCNWNVEEAYFSTHFRPYQVDQISRHIIPLKYTDLVPICSTRDGNCLFNSASLAICKNESHAFELQLRTCLELTRNNDFYKTHPVLVNSKVHYHSGRQGPSIMSVETLCNLTCFDASSSCVYGKRGFDAAFENEIMRASINYSYIGTLQIMALASILRVPMQTIYLDQKHKLLPVYESVFEPRQGYNSSNSVFVGILWTNTQGWSDRSKEFTVNHFVPLFKLEDNAIKSQFRKKKAKSLKRFTKMKAMVTTKSQKTTTAQLDKIRAEKNRENVNHKIKIKSCQQKEKTEELNKKCKEKKAQISENKQSQSEKIKESSKNAEQMENEDNVNMTEESGEYRLRDTKEHENAEQSEEIQAIVEEKTD